MNFYRVIKIIFPIIAVSAMQSYSAVNSPVDNFDSSSVSAEVTAGAEERRFQEANDKLFNQRSYSIDTSGWCTAKINGPLFDYRTMIDTVIISLADSLRGKLFTCPFKNHITSPFGPRWGFWHFGIDIKVNAGDSIRCAFDGMVRIIQYDRRGYGFVVVVRHHDFIETLYGHLSKSLVRQGQEMKSGDIIGLGGNTGRSTGSHLHLETRYKGEPFDPELMIDFGRGALRSDTFVLTRKVFDHLTEVRKTVRHTIRKGETLSGIALRYGTTVRKLCALNGISPKTILRIGRRIVVRRFNAEDGDDDLTNKISNDAGGESVARDSTSS